MLPSTTFSRTKKYLTSICWNKGIEMFLRRQNFRPSAADPCFYIRDKGEKKLLLVLYVDDGILAASDMEDLNLFLAHIRPIHAEFDSQILP